jgi:Mrp family chromosome partitioning ATPase
MAQRAAELLHGTRTHVLGVVLNNADTPRGAYGYDGYYYYSGYSYYGDGEEGSKKKRRKHRKHRTEKTGDGQEPRIEETV